MRVSLVNDYQVVLAGLARVLEPYADRLVVVERDSRLPNLSDVDLLLYDTFGAPQGENLDVEGLTRGSPTKVVVFSWNHQPELVRAALAQGAAGYLSKQLDGAGIVDALERIHAGETVVPTQTTEGADGSGADTFGRWPGDKEGLSAREAEMVALVTQGLSNQLIAEQAYLSVNTVKTHLKSAYRKMGVSTRSQAVLWGVEHGFLPTPARVRLRDPQRNE